MHVTYMENFTSWPERAGLDGTDTKPPLESQCCSSMLSLERVRKLKPQFPNVYYGHKASVCLTGLLGG